MKINYIKYNFIFLAIGIIPIALLVSLNYLIDPYQVFQSKFFMEVGQTQERYLKIELLKKNRTFDTLLLGGSRMGTTRPDDVDKILESSKTYNLFVSSGNQYDNLMLSNWIIKFYPNAKHLYIQVDWPESFGPVREHLQYLTHPDVAGVSNIGFTNKYLFTLSYEAFKFKLANNFARKGEFKLVLDKGNFYYPNRDNLLALDCAKYKIGVPDFNTHFNEAAETSQQKMLNKKSIEAIREVVEAAKNKYIEVHIFITPHNHNFLDKINLNEYLDFLRQLSSISPYWNFGFYSNVTTDDCNYYESSHYISHVGELVFKSMRSRGRDYNYGRYVSENNIDAEVVFIKSNFKSNR